MQRRCQGVVIISRTLGLVSVIAALTLPSPSLASATVHSRSRQPEDDTDGFSDDGDDVELGTGAQVQAQDQKALASMLVAQKIVDNHREPAEGGTAADAKVDATNAHEAAKVAKQAAKVANKVAEHSMHITSHAKSALKHALGALHDARVETDGLNSNQKESLKKAEGRLREATEKAEYGKLKKVKSEQEERKEHMQDEIARKTADKKRTELEQMEEEVREMRKDLAAKGGDAGTDNELQQIEDELDKLKATDKHGVANDELKVEIERLREQIDKMDNVEAKQTLKHELPQEAGQKEADAKIDQEPEVKLEPLKVERKSPNMAEEATPVEEKGIDIDTQLPFGDLEPFGREDTAQELTEASVKESDGMVDQLERAEVAEEKRAVFRALTRLRGAAITSFDGVARSQTGNIDEYNKVHQWRKSHPLHHLADEESDVAKWAFPDNAD